MPFFSSIREQRLWFWVMIVLVAIYSTLGVAGIVADALLKRNLMRVSFAALILLFGAYFIWRWVRERPSWSEIGVALGVAFAYWMTFIRIENPAERTHIIEYGVVAALIHMALLERADNGRHVPMPAALTVAATACLGLLDEGIQFFLPSRVFDWNDVVFNAFAGFMLIVARLALVPVKLPGWRLWFLWILSGGVAWGVAMDPSWFGEGNLVELPQSIPAVIIPAYSNVAVGAIVVGVLQWLILRRYLSRSIEWVPANVVAAVLGALLVWVLGLIRADLGRSIGVASYGTLAGIAQWMVLRRQKISKAGWWVLATATGWIIAIPVGDITGPPGWAIYGAVTGTVLVWLLRQEVPIE